MFCRYNISHLEQWLRDNRLVDCGAAQNLEPIVQASQLLQARKTDTDVDSIVEMCSKLSTSQVQMSFIILLDYSNYVGWLVVFYVPSTVRSFREGTPIYCPLQRT